MILKKRCKITFVLHGSTIFTAENRIYDGGDYPPLDDSGREEIEKLSKWLKKRSPKTDKILTAPTLRSIQSANIISKAYNQPIEILDDLTSKNEGLWAGFSFHELEEKYPKLLDAYHADSVNFKCGDSESILEFDERVYKIVQKIVAKNFGKRIIIVGDSSFIRAIISKAFELPACHQNKISLSTGSATQINFFESWAILMYSNYVPL